MLLFRSEEHVKRWLAERKLERGAIFSLEQGWQLARIWYHDRLSPGYARRSPAEAESVFDSLGLRGDFWKLSG